jgi:hypothetical protein
MQDCPQPGKWAISAWSGDDATDTNQALDTCGEQEVAAAYYIDPDTQGCLRWFDGRPELSNLQSLDDMQGVLAHRHPHPPSCPTALPSSRTATATRRST